MGDGGRRRLPLRARRLRGAVRRRCWRPSARRRRARGHPRLQILGLLEARLLAFDRVLLAGLDETVWPPAAETDAFLNRPMRAELGLSPPERRIGQTAHDFVAALGAREAILTPRAQARRRADRRLALPAAHRGASPAKPRTRRAEARGARYLALAARARPRPPPIGRSRRPEPKPPLALRPRQLSVTRIETLRRDPYAIYAERILEAGAAARRSAPMIGPREIGDVWHAALRGLRRSLRRRRVARRGARALIALARKRFRRAARRPEFPRSALAAHRRRRSTTSSLSTPSGASAPSAFSSSARASSNSRSTTARASRSPRAPTASSSLSGGGAALIDYKTGAPPGKQRGRGRLRAATHARSGDARRDGALRRRAGDRDD